MVQRIAGVVHRVAAASGADTAGVLRNTSGARSGGRRMRGMPDGTLVIGADACENCPVAGVANENAGLLPDKKETMGWAPQLFSTRSGTGMW